MVSLEVRVSAVESGPDRLAAQLPVLASVSPVDGTGVGYLGLCCAEFASPLRIALPDGIDPAGCEQDYFDEDDDGPFVWTYFAALLPRRSTERLDSSGRRQMSAELGIFANQSEAGSDRVGTSPVVWSATVTLTEAGTADVVVGGAESLESLGRSAFWSKLPSRRTLLISGAVAAAVLLGVAIGLWIEDSEDGQAPSGDVSTSQTSTATTTSAQDIPPPPPPPPPTPTQTYVPYYPPRQTRTNITTPQTRPPDISVRPTHRTAFPGQPGAN